MRYSLEPKYRRYVPGYAFLSFARKTGIEVAKKFGDKYGKNLMDTAKRNKELILLKQLVKK